MSEPAASHAAGSAPRSVAWVSARRRVMELLIVFFGVYAAFLLNRFDTDRHDTQRRQQILGVLEREISSHVDEFRHDLAEADAELAGFDRQLAHGDMPPLGIFINNSGYSPSDDATLLQAGGLELLDIETLELLRQVNAMHRSVVSSAHNIFELSLTELTNHESPDFYDPATHQLKKVYQWYPRLLHALVSDGKALLSAQENLLAHLRAQQNPRAPAATPAPSPAARTTPSNTPAASTPPA